jgi:F-type H+-transporting ATPase subunit epsilon
MAEPLHLTIVSPEKVLFDGDVKYLHVPGGGGFFGVLVDHVPLLASLKPGPFEIRPLAGAAFKFTTTSPGFFEVVKNKASILLDAADTAAFAPVRPV